MLIILCMRVVKDRSDVILQHTSALFTTDCSTRRIKYGHGVVPRQREITSLMAQLASVTFSAVGIKTCLLLFSKTSQSLRLSIPFLMMPFLVVWRFGSDVVMSSVTLKQKQTMYNIIIAASSIFCEQTFKCKMETGFSSCCSSSPTQELRTTFTLKCATSCSIFLQLTGRC